MLGCSQELFTLGLEMTHQWPGYGQGNCEAIVLFSSRLHSITYTDSSWTTSFQTEKAHKVAGSIQKKRNKLDHVLVKFLYSRDKEEILTSFQAKMWYLNEKIIRPGSDSDLHFLALYIVKQHTWTFERKDRKSTFLFWAKISFYMKATTDFFSDIQWHRK